ncbi:BZ3500_MvSof-1268-A1-R1_Chr9g10331 [Microbotryum saponariae]|uniref:Diphthamide biosynthesis protein 4 n=1 Tax=Microbotryum saponariae TaxID=289078 RepID=A0A2X0L120_9BASI|nr:BZ3501_MvSof-1269-A2-R1_Chr9g10081 [Microbotryum saponariae]SCZ99911.1 BZ3500_MvSof-1268-A1-R1_Chr9g10331 [Microbotryum saponariae]
MGEDKGQEADEPLPVPLPHPRQCFPNCAFSGSVHLPTLATSLPDHYATLHVPSTADLATVRAAYRALILLHHPDRATAVERSSPNAAEALNEAWHILGDPTRRKAYDRESARQQQAQQELLTSSCVYAVSIDLSLFTAHYHYSESNSPEPKPEFEDSLMPIAYTHPCRCSAEFRITLEQLEQGVQIVQCEGCSERCKVEYHVVESGDEDEERASDRAEIPV